ncbi:Lactoylglutathione lyase [Lobosporangium transversale]|uniref:lactoylglutathione lyase n=1 Tax=Lobosporangium transversale TaxID=64571 RepID=A0A1Y2GRC2_9FUNG|nr:lactoylglutathione lyase [Lobosporangium transversale]KAF9899081.1 Lactoylglutathione lyase [Lobosporangium transversale]ORZ15008.1 lactoylglutathione lyase [Lobosporangium transversale]|eukprot:XP_021881140.1 lactoylglutathione lyase [Lobosporangium transversale]
MSQFNTDIKTYEFNHTMIRVKDPGASLHFYQEILGMKLVSKMDNEGGKFTLYFLAYVNDDEFASLQGKTEEQRRSYVTNRAGVLELTHNWGTEDDANFSYANGNQDPGRGFGHTAIVVDDIEEACKRFESFGDKVKWVKRLTDGKMKNIAFIADPDGYWVEILRRGHN